jgi:hypothetical protein
MMKLASKVLIVSLVLATTSLYADNENGDSRSFIVNMVPLNSSGIYAEVELELINGKTLHVEIEASGLEPGKPHPQHIHGFNRPENNSTCPTAANDTNGDGIITITEGIPAFGPILLPLVPFDLVDASGNLDYEATFTINPGTMQPLHKRTVVLHGMTVRGAYVPSLPVACGEIVKSE